MLGVPTDRSINHVVYEFNLIYRPPITEDKIANVTLIGNTPNGVMGNLLEKNMSNFDLNEYLINT